MEAAYQVFIAVAHRHHRRHGHLALGAADCAHEGTVVSQVAQRSHGCHSCSRSNQIELLLVHITQQLLLGTPAGFHPSRRPAQYMHCAVKVRARQLIGENHAHSAQPLQNKLNHCLKQAPASHEGLRLHKEATSSKALT